MCKNTVQRTPNDQVDKAQFSKRTTVKKFGQKIKENGNELEE